MLTFAPRSPIRLENDRLTMIAVEVVDGMRMWSLRRRHDAQIIRRTQAELEAAYEHGLLVSDRDGDLPDLTREVRRRRNSMSPEDLSTKGREHFDLVDIYLRELDERLIPGTENTLIKEGDHAGKTNLQVALDNLAEIHGKRVSRASIYRWRKHYREGDPRRARIGDHGAKGNRRQMHPVVAGILNQVLLERLAEAQVDGADRSRTTQSALVEEVRQRVEEAKKLPLVGKLAPPVKSTVQEHWNKLPAYERDVAKHGRVRADNMYRGPKGGHEARHALDVVEFDETQTPFYMFDEATGIPLGRPWLSWFLDRCSQQPLGFHLGFEAIGDLTFCSALRHACSTKGWVAEHYPSIENRFEAGGIGRQLVFDNTLSNWAGTVRSLTASLDSDYKFSRSRSPWLKYTVEGMHDLLNRALIGGLPGFVLSDRIDRVDYDPLKMGCIGMRTFLAIFHKWLLDVYQVTPHGILRDTPLNRWRNSTQDVPPGYPDRAADLDVIFGVLRDGAVDRRLDHNGVVFENIRYWSEEIGRMRYRNGHVFKVRCKVNPSNLHRVKVYDQTTDSWITAVARDEAYAADLSLHVHMLQQKFARQRLGGIDVERLHRARTELGRMIKEAPRVADSIRTNTQLARAVGVGTQHILDCVDSAGRLGPLTGPFQGQILDPYTGLPAREGSPVSRMSVAAPVAQRAPAPVPPAPVPVCVQTPALVGVPAPAASPFGNLPVFKADKSLRQH